MSRNANELQENSNASSKEEYILQILPVLLIINKTGNINLQNIFLFKRSIWVFLELICRWTRQLLKTYNWTNYFIFGTPWPPDLLCKHWLTFSVRNFSLTFLLSKCPKQQAAGRHGCFCWIFSVQRGSQPKMRPTHLTFELKGWSASEAKGFCNSFCIQHMHRINRSLLLYTLFCWSIWEPLKKPLKAFIIYSKYFPDSDWLRANA